MSFTFKTLKNLVHLQFLLANDTKVGFPEALNEEKWAIFRGTPKIFLARFFFGMCADGTKNAVFRVFSKQLTMVKSEFTSVKPEFTSEKLEITLGKFG